MPCGARHLAWSLRWTKVSWSVVGRYLSALQDLRDIFLTRTSVCRAETVSHPICGLAASVQSHVFCYMCLYIHVCSHFLVSAFARIMTYRADDPEALQALLYKGSPQSVHTALVDSGYTTLGSLAFAVPSAPHVHRQCVGLRPCRPRCCVRPSSSGLCALSIFLDFRLPVLRLHLPQLLMSCVAPFSSDILLNSSPLIPCRRWSSYLPSSKHTTLATPSGFLGACVLRNPRPRSCSVVCWMVMRRLLLRLPSSRLTAQQSPLSAKL